MLEVFQKIMHRTILREIALGKPTQFIGMHVQHQIARVLSSIVAGNRRRKLIPRKLKMQILKASNVRVRSMIPLVFAACLQKKTSCLKQLFFLQTSGFRPKGISNGVKQTSWFFW